MPRRKFDAWLMRPDSRVALVGASGWIGAALADRALAAGLPPDRLSAFTTAPRTLNIAGAMLQTQLLTSEIRLDDGEWLVLHAGVLGPDRVANGDLTEVRRRNDQMLTNVLRLADTGNVRRLIAISSGAAHHPGQGSAAKAAYSRMKRDHEAVAADWGARSGRSVLLPRVFNLGGPYMTSPQNYALGDFILSQARTGRIKIGSSDPVVRDFTHVLELASILLDMAVDEAEGPDPFDIGGGQSVELGELAGLVADAFGQEAQIDRPTPGTSPGDRYVGDGQRYQTVLAKAGLTSIPLPQIVADTVAYLRQTGAIN